MSDAASDLADNPPLPARGWPRQRVLGVVLMGVWIVLGIGLVAFLIASGNPHLFAR